VFSLNREKYRERQHTARNIPMRVLVGSIVESTQNHGCHSSSHAFARPAATAASAASSL
jgi:hypothetical protein